MGTQRKKNRADSLRAFDGERLRRHAPSSYGVDLRPTRYEHMPRAVPNLNMYHQHTRWREPPQGCSCTMSPALLTVTTMQYIEYSGQCKMTVSLCSDVFINGIRITHRTARFVDNQCGPL